MPRIGNPNFGVTPGQRFAAGCIVTFTDGTVRHFTGEGRHATLAAAEYADNHELSVRTISTPTTVYRDLQGNRQVDDVAADKTHRSTKLELPEARLLGMIGRKDLIA